MKDNIIKFKNKNKLTDSDINSLFLGLVKLIKKVALEDASQNKCIEIENAEKKCQEKDLMLAQKEEEIEKLKRENKLLRSQLKNKNFKILHLSCITAEKLRKQSF